MTLLFDENFSPKLVSALRALDRDVIHLLQHRPRGTSDIDVFRLVQELGVCLVTKDAKIRRRKHEQEAYRQAGIGVLIFTGTAQRTLMEELAFLAEMIEVMEQLTEMERPPFVFEVTDRKKINRLE